MAADQFLVQYLSQLHSERVLLYVCALRVIFVYFGHLVLEWVVRLEQVLRNRFPTKVLFQRQYPVEKKPNQTKQVFA